MGTEHLEGPVCREDDRGPQCKTYTIGEAAQLLGIGRSMAYELARAGELPGAKRLGHRFVVSKVALDGWLGDAA
jgi:excisionase family DNA binding protein